MTYFKINGNDYSLYVNELKVDKKFNYNAQTNAAGNMVVDLINSKREIEVGIIPLNDKKLSPLLAELENLEVSISYLDPITNTLVENLKCIIPSTGVEYYTIQANKVMYKELSLKFTEM